jgi:hypothetical protein
MVYCPNCQSDHSAETVVCPDCRQTLVEKIDATRPVAVAPDDSWVAVANIKGTKLAEKAKNSLDANNIPSMIMPKTFAQPFNSPEEVNKQIEAPGYYQEKLLMVPREYKSEAKIIVKNVLKNETSQL